MEIDEDDGIGGATQDVGADFEDERILGPSRQGKVSCGSCHMSSSCSPFYKGNGVAVVKPSDKESSDGESLYEGSAGFNE